MYIGLIEIDFVIVIVSSQFNIFDLQKFQSNKTYDFLQLNKA